MSHDPILEKPHQTSSSRRGSSRSQGVKDRPFRCFAFRFLALNVLIVAGACYGAHCNVSERDVDSTNSLSITLLPVILLLHVFSTY